MARVDLRAPFTVSVEGNIGAGKTTFIEYCDGLGVFDICFEPVEQWKNVDGVNVLDKYYKDPKVWGMTFQTLVNLTLLKTYLKKTTRTIRVMERSLGSARHCFAKLMAAEGTLEPGMSAVLHQWYDHCDQQHRARPDLIVYMRTSPVVAYDRMIKRSRAEEISVTMEYIQKVHDLHEELGTEYFAKKNTLQTHSRKSTQ